MKSKNVLYFLAGFILILTGILSGIYITSNVILQLVGTLGSGVSLGILIFYIITSIPTFEGISAWIARGISFWKIGEKSAVAHQIQKSLNLAQEEINEEANGLIPFPAKVEWVDKESYLDTDEEIVIIRMKEHEENPRNVAYAAIDYITKGMIPYSRPYLIEPLQTAIDSTMVRRILLKKDASALDYYLTNVLNKKLTQLQVQQYIDIMNNLDEHGLFTRIYLEEIKELGLSLYPANSKSAIIETEDYAKHLDILASRKTGELNKAEPFLRNNIKVAFVLIAETTKLREEGLGNHLGYAKHCIDDGAEVIFLLSRGAKMKPAKKLADAISYTGKMKIRNQNVFFENYKGSQIETLIIEMRKE